jgi:hypothetical protein
LAAQAIVATVFGAAATSNLAAVALQEMNFWIGFYTANPTGTGLPNPTAEQILVAARATTAGDMVGVAIDGNIGTLKSIADNVLIGDGLHLNGQGPNVLGVAEPAAVPATFLQGQPFNTFVFTEGQDTFVDNSVNAVFSAPLSVNGNPTLTDFDSAVEQGTGAVLNASFDGDHIAANLNLVNIPTWNILQDDGDVEVDLFAGPGRSIQGLTTLNYNASGNNGSLAIGTAAFPILPAPGASFNGFSISVMNATNVNASGVGFLDIAMLSSGFGASDTITVTALNVGDPTNHDPDGDGRYDIAAGSPNKGFATWIVNSHTTTQAGNVIGLGADGSQSATKLVVTDDGSNTTLFAATASGSSAFDWANLTNIDLTATSGFVTLTGAESVNGLLSENTSALRTIEGGSGNSLYDLTAVKLGAVPANAHIDGGHGTSGNSEVEFNNSVITGVTSPVNLTHIQVLDDSSDIQGGTINMANWPIAPLNVPFALPEGGHAPAGFALLQFLDSSSNAFPEFDSNLVIQNGPAQFAINMQDANFNGNDFTISQGPIVNTVSTLDVWVPDTENNSGDGNPHVTINNYTTANVFMPTEGGIVKLGTTSFNMQPVVTVNNASLNFFDNHGDTGGTSDNLKLGNVFDTAVTGSFHDIGHASVFVDATLPTTITDQGAGTFAIGATDVSVLSAPSTAGLAMALPDTGNGVGGDQHGDFPENSFLVHGVTVTGSAGSANLLQGSAGTLTATNATNGVYSQAYIGGIHADTITGGSAADNVYGEGGNDTVNLNGGSDAVWFGVIHEQDVLGDSANFIQAVTDINSGEEIGVNGYLGVLANITTVNGFNLGATGDVLNIAPGSWALGTLFGGSGFDFGLLDNQGNLIGFNHDASMALIAQPGATPNLAEVTLDNIATYANAGALLAALKTPTVGDINFGIGIAPGELFHVLIAYGTGTGVNIADLSVLNTTGSGQLFETANANLTFSAHDLVDLVGTTSLGNLNPHNIHFVNGV